MALKLVLVFPIKHVDRLHESLQFCEHVRLTHTCNLILDTVQKSVIEMVAEHPISIVMDLACDAIELYNVFDDTLLTCYEQEVEFVLSIRD